MASLLLAPTLNAQAKRENLNIYQRVKVSDSILVCRTAADLSEVPPVKIIAVIKGGIPQKAMTWPLDEGSDVSTRRPLPPHSEYVVFFEGARKDILRVSPPEHKATIAGIRRLMAIAEIKSGHARDLAMFEEAISSNSFLRSEARQYILKIPSNVLNDSYHAQLLSLLKGADDNGKSLALQAIRFTKDKDFIPLAIAATKSRNEKVLDNASLMLAQQLSPEATAALIALTRHPASRIRARAAIDLSDRRRAGALEVIAGLLNDPSPSVRAAAARGLVAWHRSKEKESISSVPRLIAMLEDPNEEVQVSVLNSLAEAHDSRAVKPLLRVLCRKALSERVEKFTVEALSKIILPDRYTGYIDKGAVRLVNAQLPIFVKIIDSNRWGALLAIGIVANARTPESIAILDRTAKGHPDQAVCHYAQWRLAHQP
ncbi:MAG: hypothetical protein A2X34_01335 [Elusimicrobia bacterium GWC2_51_8]|nr:MAG: hypothetical protein A2X33_04665 [Elusimicrobia bacterium GWA2_51_34]OGR58171.1 MAG: hypothetical protein A2X34_01335 [Elusimicrobia bacterium GWC2_51_8]OGR85437.1 MAG: hypothetical protein A2021_06120 [Elusimicrobia bacterium GWF2_52_66]